LARVKSQNETFEMLCPGTPEKAIKSFSVKKGNAYDKSKLKVLVGGWEVYHLSGHQTKVVALGGIAKRNGVSSRISLLIYMKCLWITLSPLQCPPAPPLKRKKTKSNKTKNIKGIEWARKQWHP
jgi:hypothetical protein